MSLSEINKKLYKRDGAKELPKIEQTDFDVRKASADPKEVGFKKEEEDKWKEDKSELKKENNKAIKVGGIIFASVLLLALLGTGFYFLKKTSFNNDRVSIQTTGLKNIASGKSLEYEIIIENNNRATLKGAILEISYPDNFIPENNPNFISEGALGGHFEVGDIKGKEKKKILFNGKVYSPKGTIMYLKTKLLFYPTGFSGQFSTDNQFDSNIISSPISLDVLAPQNMSSDDSLDYLISYKNEGKEDYSNIKIRIEYPDGFTFSKSEPRTSEGENSWYVGRLSAGQEGKIVVSGKLGGESGNIKRATVYVGEVVEGKFVAQNEEKAETKIEASPLAISQTVNGLKDLNVNAGDTLNFKIHYKNEGVIGLGNVIVTAKIDSDILDYSTLLVSRGGSIDMENKTIIWRAAGVPGLKNLNPGDSGMIDFSVKIKDIIPVKGVQDKNFVVSSIAKIDSPDIQSPIEGNKIISGNKMDMRLNSKLFLGAKGLYYDTFTNNSGPLPPKVGEKTTYTINWILMNVSNDVTEAKVQSSLPSGVDFTGKIEPEDSNLTYDKRANSIVWDVGNLDAGTGILTSSKEVSFQVSVVPTPNQTGKEASIINKAVLTGKDLFTGEGLSFTVNEKTTMLVEDKKVDKEEYKVSE